VFIKQLENKQCSMWLYLLNEPNYNYLDIYTLAIAVDTDTNTYVLS